MRKAIACTAIVLLGVLTVFEGIILYLAQIGNDFSQSGPEPIDLLLAWSFFAVKIVGLGVSRITGLVMISAGMAEWILLILLGTRGQHEAFGSAVSDPSIYSFYVVLAVIYTVAGQRWRWKTQI